MDEQVAVLLQSTLSAAADTRIQAEISLKELHKSGEAALSLARICLAQSADIALRQSAGINLKKYVREHWSAAFESFEGNPPSHEIKDQIRQAVFTGLSDSTRKIRLACASIVSEIASSDWPDEWPSLLDSLVQLLNSGHTDSVHGAMRVLSDFVSTDLSEDQLLPLSNAMLPQLLQILGDERYSPVTRAQSVAVFHQCISTLYMIKDSHPQAAKYASEQVLPQWAAAFSQILSSEPQSNGSWTSLHVRNEMFSTLGMILTAFPKSISSHLEAFLLDAARHITILAAPFRSTALNDDLEDNFSLDVEDDTSLTLPIVLSNIILFIADASRRGTGKSALVDKGKEQPTDLLQQIVYLAVYYAQITQEDEERWTNDLNAFVEDEDEDMPASTLRTASLDLVQSFFNSFSKATIRALVNAVDRIIQESDELRAGNQQDWWKGYESALEHFSSVGEELIEHVQECRDHQQQPLFDLERSFDRLVAPFLSSPDVPFLQGRALIFASRFATQLPENLQQQFFQSSLQLFESQDTSFILKVCALRALKNFCEQIPDSVTFASLGNRIASDLLPLVSQAREGTLMLVFETLQRTLGLETVQRDPQLCNDFVSALLQPVMNGSLKNPVLQSTLCDLIRKFASSSSPHIHNSLRDIALPRLATLLSQTNEDDETRQQVDSAMVVINAIFDGRPSPMGDGLFAPIGQALFSTLNRTDDDNVLQDGLECLTYVVRKDVDQLTQWLGADGQNGLAALFGVVALVLRPDRSESASLFVGDLLLHVFRRAGEAILPILPDLLQALLLRLTTAQTSTFTQSLILPFAYLMHSQTETVLDLLENVHIGSRNGVEILLPAWTDNVDSILGFWNIRISSVALGKLLLTNRASVNNLTVKGDLIVNQANSGVILTRSRAKKNPDQYARIPFKAKALKIILKELEQASEAEAVEVDDSPHDDLGGDDEWEDDEDAEAAKGAIDLSHFVGGASSFLNDEGDDIDDEGDEDLKTDPVYTMDMPQHLKQTVRTFAAQNRPLFDACLPYLDASESHTLHSI